jgi:putative transposase
MIDRADPLPMTQQCRILALSRSSVYYQPVPLSDRDLELMGICALYPKRRTSLPGGGHKIYPYLLRDLPVERANPDREGCPEWE